MASRRNFLKKCLGVFGLGALIPTALSAAKCREWQTDGFKLLWSQRPRLIFDKFEVGDLVCITKNGFVRLQDMPINHNIPNQGWWQVKCKSETSLGLVPLSSNSS